MLSAAELERMLVEDRQQRARHDDALLAALGIVDHGVDETGFRVLDVVVVPDGE